MDHHSVEWEMSLQFLKFVLDFFYVNNLKKKKLCATEAIALMWWWLNAASPLNKGPDHENWSDNNNAGQTLEHFHVAFGSTKYKINIQPDALNTKCFKQAAELCQCGLTDKN